MAVMAGEGRAVSLVPWLVRFHPERGLMLLSYHLCFVLPPATCFPQTVSRFVRHWSTLFSVIDVWYLYCAFTRTATDVYCCRYRRWQMSLWWFGLLCFCSVILCEVVHTVLVFAVMCVLLFYLVAYIAYIAYIACIAYTSSICL